MTDYELLNKIQAEQNNLTRGHVYYSIEEEPDVCAQLVAQGVRGCNSSEDLAHQLAEEYKGAFLELGKRVVEKMSEAFSGSGGKRVTVNCSERDMEAAIRLIRERMRK